MNPNNDLLIKGYRSGVLITLPDFPCQAQHDLLIRRIQSQERFFKGGRIALDVGKTVWNDRQIVKLLRDLSDEGVCLWAILSTAPQTLEAAATYDIPTSIKRDDETTQQATEIMPPPATITWLERDIEEKETLEVEGKLCLIGDVNASAILKAEASILVWGKVYGEIWAGQKFCPLNTLCVLNYQGADLHLNGKAVVLSQKIKKGSALRVTQDGETQHVDIVKNRWFGF